MKRIRGLKSIGGGVRNRTAVRNQVSAGVYMLREVVWFNLASHNLQSYARRVWIGFVAQPDNCTI